MHPLILVVSPFSSPQFFHKSDLSLSFYIPKHKVSHVIPQHFQERILRVFVCDPTPEKIRAAGDAIRYFLERNNGISPKAPMRSLSSPGTLTAAQPIRGGSVFTRPIGNGHGIVEESVDAMDEADESMGAESSNFSVQLTPYAARTQSVQDRLLAAADGNGDSAPTPLLPPLPATPTRADRDADAPPTIILDRHAEKPQEANGAHTTGTTSTPRALQFAAPAATASSKRAFAMIGAASTPVTSRLPPSSPYRRDRESISSSPCPTPTPMKRRGALFKPATPVGKLAAAAAASRGHTPSTARTVSTRGTPSSEAATPQSQANKRQKVQSESRSRTASPPPTAATSAKRSPRIAAAAAAAEEHRPAAGTTKAKTLHY